MRLRYPVRPQESRIRTILQVTWVLSIFLLWSTSCTLADRNKRPDHVLLLPKFKRKKFFLQNQDCLFWSLTLMAYIHNGIDPVTSSAYETKTLQFKNGMVVISLMHTNIPGSEKGWLYLSSPEK